MWQSTFCCYCKVQSYLYWFFVRYYNFFIGQKLVSHILTFLYLFSYFFGWCLLSSELADVQCWLVCKSCNSNSVTFRGAVCVGVYRLATLRCTLLVTLDNWTWFDSCLTTELRFMPKPRYLPIAVQVFAVSSHFTCVVPLFCNLQTWCSSVNCRMNVVHILNWCSQPIVLLDLVLCVFSRYMLSWVWYLIFNRN